LGRWNQGKNIKGRGKTYESEQKKNLEVRRTYNEHLGKSVVKARRPTGSRRSMPGPAKRPLTR
jgi:hypothetical protein